MEAGDAAKHFHGLDIEWIGNGHRQHVVFLLEGKDQLFHGKIGGKQIKQFLRKTMADKILDGLEIELLGESLGQFLLGDYTHLLEYHAKALLFTLLAFQCPFKCLSADEFGFDQYVSEMLHNTFPSP